ncbi:hypothetical protein [Cellulomonas soli]
MSVRGWGWSVARPALTLTSDAPPEVVWAAATAVLRARHFAVSTPDGTTLRARRIQWWNLLAQNMPMPIALEVRVLRSPDGSTARSTTQITLTRGRHESRVRPLVCGIVDHLVARVRRTGADMHVGEWWSDPVER